MYLFLDTAIFVILMTSVACETGPEPEDSSLTGILKEAGIYTPETKVETERVDLASC